MLIYILLSVISAGIIAIIIIQIMNKPPKVDQDKMLSELKDSFQSLSFTTLKEQTAMGEKTLEEKKKLIDQTLQSIQKELDEVQKSISRFDSGAKSGFDVIAEKLQYASKTTSDLQQTTENLKKVLSDPTARGQWGEKMAEDVLRLAGFMEDINYKKQKTQASGSKPDFTFLLPKGMKVNMDSKFPFGNYMKYVETNSETDKETYKKQFINDVKQKIKEVTSRDYINPEENTVDYVILFIPNEQVYSFINENDRLLLDAAMKQKVIICSPLTLYAILAVIRQAMDNFNLAAKTNEVFRYVEEFKKQWLAFSASMEKMGRSIDAAQKEYTALSTTRSKQVDRVVDRFEELKGRKDNLLE